MIVTNVLINLHVLQIANGLKVNEAYIQSPSARFGLRSNTLSGKWRSLKFLNNLKLQNRVRLKLDLKDQNKPLFTNVFSQFHFPPKITLTYDRSLSPIRRWILREDALRLIFGLIRPCLKVPLVQTTNKLNSALMRALQYGKLTTYDVSNLYSYFNIHIKAIQ